MVPVKKKTVQKKLITQSSIKEPGPAATKTDPIKTTAQKNLKKISQPAKKK